MKNHSPDLTKTFPRSPYETLGGMVHLPRMTDKARAKQAGQLGEYIYPCPLDQGLLAFLEIDAETFFERVNQQNDDELAHWIQETGAKRTEAEVREWNTTFLSHAPLDDETKARFLKMRAEIAPERSDVTTWVDLIELDEGRPVPLRTI